MLLWTGCSSEHVSAAHSPSRQQLPFLSFQTQLQNAQQVQPSSVLSVLSHCVQSKRGGLCAWMRVSSEWSLGRGPGNLHL